MKLRRAFLILALLVPGVTQARLEALKGFDKDLAAHGVTERYSPSGMEALLTLVGEQIAEADRQGERFRGVADAARRVLDRATQASASSDPAALRADYDALRSFLYSLRSEVRGEVKTCLLADILRLFNNASLEVPYLAPADRARPLTPGEALLEATNLVDPKTGRGYADPAELAGLSPAQISELDVRPDDYVWHDEATLAGLKARHGTAWKALEAQAEARAAAVLHAPYSLSGARRILLFRGIKSTATTPKIDAEDLQGQSWKVKWGEEVQAEPVANHLYAELGGKFADLVYANKGGPSDLVLVLDEAGSHAANERCESIATFDDFKHCLRKSRYKFDVSAYVVSHGVVSEATLREEPFASTAGPASGLVGREFVTFNESLVEFQPSGDGARPLGAAPLSSTGSRSQRALRGLAILTYWIHNKDAKDANTKGLVVDDATYVQYFHDMGASMGSLRISGNPNLLKVGDAFARRRHHDVKFHSHMLYLPKAFHDATYADAMWMVRKIMGLSREDLLAAVAATRWPDFQQNVLASRLIGRRNAMALAFDFDSIMPLDVAPTVVSLRTPADRRAAVTRYALPIATHGDADEATARLEEFMTASGIAMTDGIAEFDDRPDRMTEDAVLETTDCKRSILVSWLEQTIQPAGLSRRVYRRADDKPLKVCRPTRRSLSR